MAWSSTNAISKTPLRGGLSIIGGTFIDATTTGESIVTGLRKVLFCMAVCSDAVHSIRLVESATAGTLTIYGEASTDDGYWFAIGK